MNLFGLNRLLQGGLRGHPEAPQRGRGGPYRPGRLQEEEHPRPAGVPGQHPGSRRLAAHLTDPLVAHPLQ